MCIYTSIGRTKDQAFAIGNQMANEITAMNPKGVVLKFEKVYLPSILVSKKRYVGYKYETIDQMEGMHNLSVTLLLDI